MRFRKSFPNFIMPYHRVSGDPAWSHLERNDSAQLLPVLQRTAISCLTTCVLHRLVPTTNTTGPKEQSTLCNLVADLKIRLETLGRNSMDMDNYICVQSTKVMKNLLLNVLPSMTWLPFPIIAWNNSYCSRKLAQVPPAPLSCILHASYHPARLGGGEFHPGDHPPFPSEILVPLHHCCLGKSPAEELAAVWDADRCRYGSPCNCTSPAPPTHRHLQPVAPPDYLSPAHQTVGTGRDLWGSPGPTPC